MSRHTITVKQSRRRRDWRTLLPVSILCTVMLIFVTYVVVAEYRDELPQKSDTPVVTLGNGQDLHMELSKLVSPQLRLLEANASGQKVRFLVQRTPDKSVRVALATCRACYRNRGLHYARNGEMTCGKCGESMIFESKDHGNVTNHCKLIEIPHKETDHDVTVLVPDVISETAKILP